MDKRKKVLSKLPRLYRFIIFKIFFEFTLSKMAFIDNIIRHHPLSFHIFDICNIGYELFIGSSGIILFIIMVDNILGATLPRDPEGLGVVQIVACYH